MNKSVLLVDDEEAIREPIAAMLRADGFTVMECSEGKHALEELRRHSYGLLITDVLMPVMNGIELLHAVRKHDHALEAIVLSSHATEATREKLKRMGVFGFLEKPFCKDKLIDMALKAVRSNRVIRLGYGSREPVITFSRERILVADDDSAMLDIIAEVLRKQGHCVTTVNNGAQALEMILINDYDCIITDINMPVMGGVEAVKAIRESDPDTFILLISGEAEKTEIKEALSNGADKFLAKPFSNDALLDIIDKIDFAKIKLRKDNAAEAERKRAARSYGWFRRLLSSHRWHMAQPKIVELLSFIIVGVIVGAIALFLGSMPLSSSDDGNDVGYFKKKIDVIERYLNRDEQRELKR
ncbi:MAG: response regulator [Chitinivibrionales bacterium]|nr:response regulator [Chitinivibrionales bacterium]